MMCETCVEKQKLPERKSSANYPVPSAKGFGLLRSYRDGGSIQSTMWVFESDRNIITILFRAEIGE